MDFAIRRPESDVQPPQRRNSKRRRPHGEEARFQLEPESERVREPAHGLDHARGGDEDGVGERLDVTA